MKVKKSNNKIFKSKTIKTCALAGIMALSALNVGLIQSAPLKVFASQSSIFSDVTISNGNFDTTSTSSYPKTASEWTTLSNNNAVTAGVISTTDSVFKSYYKSYGLFYTENALSDSDNASPNAYMINAKETQASYGIESPTFTLDARSYYVIRVDVRTGLSILDKDEITGKTIENFASAYLKIGDKVVAEKLHIQTANNWRSYYFFVATKAQESSSATVQLYLGSKEYSTPGAVLFDTLQCTKYAKNAWEEKKTATIDAVKAEYIADSGLTCVTTEIAPNIDNSFADTTKWDKTVYGNAMSTKSGVVDTTDYKSTETLVAENPQTNNETANSKLMFINIPSTSNGASVCYTSTETFNFKRYQNYLIEFYVKTIDVAGDGVHAKLIPTNTTNKDDYSAISLTSIKSSSSPLTNNWSLCQIYVQGSAFEDVEAKLEIGLGSVSDETTATGAVFFDNLEVYAIDYTTYENASTGSNIQKGSFSKTISSDSKIANSNFDLVANTAGTTAPYAPASWTASNSNNTTSGIINNKQLGFNALNEYGDFSWDFVGLTSAQSFIDKNNPTELAIANQNILMINTSTEGYQAYTSESVELSASTLYKISVDAKSMTEGAYISISYGDIEVQNFSVNFDGNFNVYDYYLVTPMTTQNLSITLGVGTEKTKSFGYAFFDAVVVKEVTDENLTATELLENITKNNANTVYDNLSANYFADNNNVVKHGLYGATSWTLNNEEGICSGIKKVNDTNSLVISSENENTDATISSSYTYNLDSSSFYKVSFKVLTSEFTNLSESGLTFGFTENITEGQYFENLIANEETEYTFYINASNCSSITPYVTLKTKAATSNEFAEITSFEIEKITEAVFNVKQDQLKNNDESIDPAKTILLGATESESEEDDDTENADRNVDTWMWAIPTLITVLAIILAFVAIIVKKVNRKIEHKGKKYKNNYDRESTIHKNLLDKEIAELREKKIAEAKAKLEATQAKLKLLDEEYIETTKDEKVNKDAEYKKLVRNRRKHVKAEESLKEEISYLESDEYTSVATAEVLHNHEKELEDFDNTTKDVEDETTLVLDEEQEKEFINASEEVVVENAEQSTEDATEIVVDDNADKDEK